MMKLKNILLPFLPGLLLLALWEAATHGNTRAQFLYASPILIARQGIEELQSAAFYMDILATLSETLLGLVFGVMLGSAAGLLLWGNGKADKIIRPYIVLFGAIPVFALAPVFIMWFGIDLLSKAVMAGFAVFFVALIQAYAGAKHADAHYAGFARSINAPHGRMIRKIIIPGALDWVFSSIKMSVGLALTGAFIGEFVSSEKGLGHYILAASSLYDMPRVFWGVSVMAVLALLMTAAADMLQKKIQRA